jgi:hypothetical protein
LKGAYILLEKNGVLVRTQFVDREVVRWFEGDVCLTFLLQQEGFEVVKKNLLNEALQRLEHLRDRMCGGRRVRNEDLLEIIEILKEY